MARWKLNLERVEESLEDKNKRLQRNNKIFILIILLMALGFLVYELKFSEKSIFDKGDKYEEYDPNYVTEDDSNIKQSEKKETSNIIEGITSNIESNIIITSNVVNSNNNTSNTTNTSNSISNIASNISSNSSNNTKTSNVVSNVTSNTTTNKVSNTTSNNVTLSPVSFSSDSWDTISKAVKNHDTSKYKIGDTKVLEMDINNDGKKEQYNVRIINISTPLECNDSTFSQTACGFVIEFVDIPISKSINETKTVQGAWKDSNLRAYLNSNFYNLLPTDLKNVIINTKVVSSHTIDETENYTTTDKIYLGTIKEFIGVDKTVETSYSKNRQFDYYISTSNSTIKKYNNGAYAYWTRSVSSYDKYPTHFCIMMDQDRINGARSPNREAGVAPIFRIG